MFERINALLPSAPSNNSIGGRELEVNRSATLASIN